MGPDGDDDTIEMNPSKPMKITYVNFDKTKPNLKPISDRLSNPLLTKKSNSSRSISNKCNGQSNHDETSNNATEKVKTKKQNKSSLEYKQSDGNPRHSKKPKKDVS